MDCEVGLFVPVDIHDIINGEIDKQTGLNQLRIRFMACNEVCAIIGTLCCDVFAAFLTDLQSIRMSSTYFFLPLNSWFAVMLITELRQVTRVRIAPIVNALAVELHVDAACVGRKYPREWKATHMWNMITQRGNP